MMLTTEMDQMRGSQWRAPVGHAAIGGFVGVCLGMGCIMGFDREWLSNPLTAHARSAAGWTSLATLIATPIFCYKVLLMGAFREFQEVNGRESDVARSFRDRRIAMEVSVDRDLNSCEEHFSETNSFTCQYANQSLGDLENRSNELAPLPPVPAPLEGDRWTVSRVAASFVGGIGGFSLMAIGIKWLQSERPGVASCGAFLSIATPITSIATCPLALIHESPQQREGIRQNAEEIRNRCNEIAERRLPALLGSLRSHTAASEKEETCRINAITRLERGITYWQGVRDGIEIS